MKFEDLLKNISKIEKKELPGELVQLEMSPKERGLFSQDFETKKTRVAAVMMLLYPKEGETYLALILRTTYDGAHSGQIAFPGGKYEKEDVDLWQTALRETNEEIGVDMSLITKIKALTTVYVPTSDFRVYPFLAMTKDALNVDIETQEVAEFIAMPVAHFLKKENKLSQLLEVKKNLTQEVPCFLFENHKIWGATAMMLNELKQLLISSMEL